MVRSPETCPHREAVDGDEATCGVLRSLLGDGENAAHHSRVAEGVCRGCCKMAEPGGGTLNPVLASVLFGCLDEIEKAGDPDGLGEKRLGALRRVAFDNLDMLPTRRTAAGARPYAGPCFYLAERVGQRPCKTCRGSVRLKVFRCAHEDHDETVVRECHKCRDYEPALGKGGRVKDWSVAVTTAPRRQRTLTRTLMSLVKAGWVMPHVFAEPKTRLPLLLPRRNVTRRRQKLGAWPNWLLSLNEMVLRDPHADAYLLAQDDALFARGLRAYLEESLWPVERLGVISLYTAVHQDRGDKLGFYANDLGWSAWGAMAYLFSNASARALLRFPRIVNHRNRGPKDGLVNVDSVVGQWCRESGLAYFAHAPSLVQHIGETSTLWKNDSLEGRRRSGSFNRGEVDIRDYMREQRGEAKP